ncbi:hypothetical protein Vadar_018111 [Vaccinium darrowii]|uniref:Uncharacterized protein n=1 Tax=Vaccinium darrowii TaxID=229202 RepID=A0ACB7X1N1_9ERIC|nr:hypothetical protein Vadar_018111 [Vaccinium darrowii]
MAPKRGASHARGPTRGRTTRRGRGGRVQDEASVHDERAGNEVSQPGETDDRDERQTKARHDRREQEVNQTGQLAAEIVAALAAQNLLKTPSTGSDARECMKDFRRMDAPTFDGDISDPLRPNHWLADIRKLFTALGINDDTTRVNLVACQFTKAANEWWDSVLALRKDTRRLDRLARGVEEPDVENMTWAEFEAIFEAQYFPESLKDQFRDQFENLKKGDTPISEYSMRFQQLSRFAPELVNTEEGKCKRFLKGLEDPLRSLVIASRCKTFAEMVETARTLEVSSGVSSGAKKEVTRPTQTTTSAPSSYYGGQGHKRSRDQFQTSHSQSGIRVPSSSGSRGGSARPPLVCHQCNRAGHVRAYCPFLPGPHSQGTQFSGTCFACGKTGHIARNCTRGGGARSVSGPIQQPRGGHSFSRGSHGQSQYRQGSTGQGQRFIERGASSSTPSQGSV